MGNHQNLNGRAGSGQRAAGSGSKARQSANDPKLLNSLLFLFEKLPKLLGHQCIMQAARRSFDLVFGVAISTFKQL
ncbi:hypothetical protein SUGI_0060680 [Cryptomeria japonica]|nr:hypothetical protein SUGI_0060680 [Cryptomeria japonica]